MNIGRTHLQSGQPFHMHADNDYNMGYLLPSLYWGVGSDKHVQTTLLQQVEASVEVVLSGFSFGRTARINRYFSLPAVVGTLPASLRLLTCSIPNRCAVCVHDRMNEARSTATYDAETFSCSVTSEETSLWNSLTSDWYITTTACHCWPTSKGQLNNYLRFLPSFSLSVYVSVSEWVCVYVCICWSSDWCNICIIHYGNLDYWRVLSVQLLLVSNFSSTFQLKIISFVVSWCLFVVAVVVVCH